MLNLLKQHFSKDELLTAEFGMEREALRVTSDGVLSDSKHPQIFGEKLMNPYITTDFSESQVEMITPTFETLEEVHHFLSALYDLVSNEIGDEVLWPQSMPAIIPDDREIPIASFCDCEEGQNAHAYRVHLAQKYGSKKQLICGMHYNFSFKDDFVKKLYTLSASDKSYQEFKNDLYLKISRNYLRYRWLLIYLLGSTAIIHESYEKECTKKLKKYPDASYGMETMLSFRNSDCGYKNLHDLYPDYSSVSAYTKSIEDLISGGLIHSHKEVYSQIRLKAKDNAHLLKDLKANGIQYLEMRTIDINPFEKAGIRLEDLYFVHLFTLYLLTTEESGFPEWQEEAAHNQRMVAHFGKQENLQLRKNGEEISMKEYAFEVLQKMTEINDTFQLEKGSILEEMKGRFLDGELTYASKIARLVEKEGYIHSHLELASKYKDEAYANRFKLTGYEDLELSTQILMKEAIKRGIKVDVIDRSDNFISLEKNGQVEYIKQATKTSADNYVSVLVMENKVVTKKVLERKGIRVPSGDEFHSLEKALSTVDKYVGQPIVIKPKSTNFGLGISIFPQGTTADDLQRAFEMAFVHDNTVLVEEFIHGKEYRFLVIGDQVSGILHRVPANVKGDGRSTITELVVEKNKDSLRGKGYKTPLEKINLDEAAQLFLKQQGLTVDSIPKADEIVYLRENSNISTGGDSIDFTDDMHDFFKKIAVEATMAVDAKICGVDLMIEDIHDPESGHAIIELNFNPAIHIHSFPYQGVERSIAEDVLRLLGMI